MNDSNEDSLKNDREGLKGLSLKHSCEKEKHGPQSKSESNRHTATRYSACFTS